ncbi:hypothetical protein [uncultured Microbacterium sp.]|uniref:hypothetical protein n=1 Tax=uncultured Microbacterium sp. TaxID=191216 RepID=UPI0025F6416C|nr:hypothetical protein [uncultured Microbacterium sp.]
MTASPSPAPAALGCVAPAPAPHAHAWITRSRHPTSEGVVVYVQCVECGSLRTDLIAAPAAVPTAWSRIVRTP